MKLAIHNEDPSGISRFILRMAFVGPLLIIIFSLSELNCFWIILAQGLLLGFAALMIGFFGGFLFGIPKYIAKNSSGRYTSNTNLEDISDWLTKILVGLGLTQLTVIPGKLQSIGLYLSENLIQIPQSVVLFIIVYFTLYGFFAGYLITRLYLSREFAKTEDHLQDLDKALEESVEVRDKVSQLAETALAQVKDIENKGGTITSDQYFKQGNLMAMAQKYDKAIEYLLKSYEMDGHYKAGSNLAMIYAKYLKQYDKAEVLYDKLIKSAPGEPLAYYNRACNYSRMGKVTEAVESLEKALQLSKGAYLHISPKVTSSFRGKVAAN